MLALSPFTSVFPHPLGQILNSYLAAGDSSGFPVLGRHKRGFAVRGLITLFDGASEIPNLTSKGFDRTFMKPGSQRSAIEDFYSTQPKDIKTYYFPFGGKALEGRLGENTIFLRTTDIAEGNRPTLWIVNTKSNEVLRKLVYQPGSKTDKQSIQGSGPLPR